MSPIKSTLLIISFSTISILLISETPGLAQFKVRKDSLEKSTWYEAPRQVQIIDDAPVVHDFRQASPPPPQYINIPANPGGGNLGTIPAGGLHFGDPNAVHTSSGPNLPRAGFGTNIPAGGIAHPGSLPGISHGGLLHPPSSSPVARQSAANPVNTYKPGPSVSSYGGYSNNGGGSSYGASQRSSEASVRGSLLRK